LSKQAADALRTLLELALQVVALGGAQRQLLLGFFRLFGDEEQFLHFLLQLRALLFRIGQLLAKLSRAAATDCSLSFQLAALPFEGLDFLRRGGTVGRALGATPQAECRTIKIASALLAASSRHTPCNR